MFFILSHTALKILNGHVDPWTSVCSSVQVSKDADYHLVAPANLITSIPKRGHQPY